MSESNSAADQVGALINKGKPRKARRLAEKLEEEDPQAQNDAHFYFQFALAVSLSGGGQSLFQELWERASDCANYTVTMEGDFYRDWALREIRGGKLGNAEQHLKRARELHAGDVNRQAAIIMVEARISYGDRDYDEAVRLHLKAAGMWLGVSQAADMQWMKNNRFHMLRAIMASNRYDKKYKRELHDAISRDDKSRNHRIGAWLAYRLGRLGNAAYDFLAKYLG